MQQGTNQALQGKRVAILMTDGVEQVEYTGPRGFLEEQGAKVTLISPKPTGDDIQGFNHLTPADKFKVELDVRDARPADFDESAFLHHAKVNFVRLQAAWNAGDMADIRAFSTPQMFAELKLELDARAGARRRADVAATLPGARAPVRIRERMIGVERDG